MLITHLDGGGWGRADEEGGAAKKQPLCCLFLAMMNAFEFIDEQTRMIGPPELELQAPDSVN